MNASTGTATPPAMSPAELLRSLADVTVTVTTVDGAVTGSLLSCTRLSVWLVGVDDADVVLPLAQILEVSVHGRTCAA